MTSRNIANWSEWVKVTVICLLIMILVIEYLSITTNESSYWRNHNILFFTNSFITIFFSNLRLRYYATLIVLLRIKIFAIVYYACSCGIVRNKNSRHTYYNMWDSPGAFCRSLNKLLTYPMLLSIINILSLNRKFAVMI